MLVDKLTQQMQLNCIITQIDFVLAFEMYRYLVASLSRKSNESKNLSISLENKEKHVTEPEKNAAIWLKSQVVYKCSIYWYHSVLALTVPSHLGHTRKYSLIKHNLDVQQRVGFVCSDIVIDLKGKKNKLEFNDFCSSFMLEEASWNN